MNQSRPPRGLDGTSASGDASPVGAGIKDTFARRLRRALLLLIALLAAASIAAGCAQASNIKDRLSPSGGARTSPDSSASVAPASPTAAPTTIAPTTVQPSVPATTPATTPPTVTATPTSAAPTPTVSGSPSPASGAGTLLWLWALLGVIVIIGLVVLISQAARRRAARNRTWRAMEVDAFAKGSALHDAVYAASLPGQSSLPGQYGAGNAAARWADIQRRADDLTQTLYALREAAPTEDERARVDDVLASLQALRSATQTGDMSPGGLYSSNLQTRLQYFQAALQALRGPE
jgi:hypothetical protein